MKYYMMTTYPDFLFPSFNGASNTGKTKGCHEKGYKS